MLESYRKLQLNPKTVPEFEDVPQLIWSALPKKRINNAVKDYRKRLQARRPMPANSGHSTYNVIIHMTDTNRYI